MLLAGALAAPFIGKAGAAAPVFALRLDHAAPSTFLLQVPLTALIATVPAADDPQQRRGCGANSFIFAVITKSPKSIVMSSATPFSQ